jgi:hypothetical protein
LATAALVAAAAGVSPTASRAAAYAPGDEALPGDTLRGRTAEPASRADGATLALGAVIPGYLSWRGLPPVPGRITVTDTGLVFRALDGSATLLPLVGPVRETGGRRWRPSTVSLAYMDEHGGRVAYVFRVDAGVFETDVPGPLLDVASHPEWLDSLGSPSWAPEKRLVDGRDSAALWTKTRTAARSTYADSLYALFGRPGTKVGLIGHRGRMAGRLGEYIALRDSLALDPSRMSTEAQLRHTLAHELGHRWQAQSPRQVAMLWWGVQPIRDPKRYGYASISEHQAEAIAFAVSFLQTTAPGRDSSGRSIRLLDHYELLVPGTRTMVRYLALQPLYRAHPLRRALTLHLANRSYR